MSSPRVRKTLGLYRKDRAAGEVAGFTPVVSQGGALSDTSRLGAAAQPEIAAAILVAVSKPVAKAEKGEERILGLDYGRVRIGLAVARVDSGLAQPLATLERVNRNEDMRRLREIVREHGVKQVVVGLPLRLDGTRGEMAEEAARFGRRVHKQLGLPVEMIDERLTSWEAERQLEEQEGRAYQPTPVHAHSGKYRAKVGTKTHVDAMAAAIILKEYLERQRTKPAA
jgi:putative holliday junction resolvase